MKKRLLTPILIVFLLIGMLPVGAEEAKTFSDVPEGHAAYEAVQFLVGKEIINGKTATEFCPNDGLKREEFAKILTQAAKLGDGSGAPIFSDVPANTWFVPYVGAAAKANYMSGISQNEFGVGLMLSRQDLAVIIIRWAEKINMVLESDSSVLFADNSDIADYAKDAVSKAAAYGIMEARENNCFMPKEIATRAEAACAVYNLLMAERENSEQQGRWSKSKNKWDGPYDFDPDDKLMENMPKPYSVENWPTTELYFEDFNDDDYGELTYSYGGGNWYRSPNAGPDGSGCIVAEDGATAVFNYYNDDLEAGDVLVIKCKLKAENISGSGNYRAILSVYDDKGNWLGESGGGSKGLLRASTDGWIEEQFITSIPEDPNALSKKKYVFHIQCYMYNLTGKVYFDDYSIRTLLYDPLETVLMTPNYKGLIYGEGGVGDIALRAHVNDWNGGYDLNNFIFKSQVVDEDDNVYMESVTEDVTPVMDVYFSSKDLKMNEDYYLENFLINKETNEVIVKRSWTLRKRPEDYRPKIYIDEDCRLIKNGEPDIHTSIFHYSREADGGFDLSQTIGTDVEAYHNNGMAWWYAFANLTEVQKDVVALEEANKGMVLSTGPFRFGGMLYQEIYNHIKEQPDVRGYLGRMIDYYKDLPIIDLYYTQDEIGGTNMGEELRWQNEIIAEHDLDHPTFGAICAKDEKNPGVWAKTTDIITSDPYPATGLPDQDLYEVTDFVSYLRDSNPNRPVGVILQGFYFSGRGNKLGKDMRGPTQEEFRNMAFQAIIEGACMLDCYAWDKKITPSPGRNIEDEWVERQEVFSEVEKLEPIMVSNLPAPYYEVKGGGKWLNSMTRRYDGKSYLFAVNNQKTTKFARFYLDGVKKITGMYSGQTYEADREGWFEIEFPAYMVEVFEYEQADYKSSHAELERFGIMDTEGNGFIMQNSEDEIPTFLIEKDTDEVTFGYQVSDYSTLYVNGEKVEKGDVINIGGLSEIKVKVVSEDGRFTTEKTFALERR
ncbi:MAG: hypothetical protein E7403_05845 [Ruminococcaceae bacterium]|nr:hypothetical protein [Oscillospiraceae bacterium]